MYEHIVVPFDGTAAAQRAGMVGADLAEMFDAELVMATAADLEGDGLRALKAAAAEMTDSHATVWVEPNPSDTDAIDTVLRFRPHSLICMHSSGRTGVRRAVYGSFAERLLRQLDVPVLVLGPHSVHSSIVNLRSVIVCVDGTPTSDAAVALAMAWAQVMPLNATVVHVRRHADEPMVDLDPTVAALRRCCEVVEPVSAVDHDAVGSVVDLARNSSGSLVVMATHARTGLQRVLQGSFSSEICHRSPLPVLVQRGPLPTVRPEWVEARRATPSDRPG